jgi:hypothetical protein
VVNTFEIRRGIPNTVLPMLTAIYGNNLSDVVFMPASTIGGTWSWVNPTDLVGGVGIQKHYARYTPDDTANFETIEVEVEIIVISA